MLNIFSWASWPSVCLLWRNVCLDFCSFFEWAVCFNGVKPYMCAKLLQSCPTVCDPMDCSPPGDLPNPGAEPVSRMSPALGGSPVSCLQILETNPLLVTSTNMQIFSPKL